MCNVKRIYSVVIIEDEPWIMRELKKIFPWEKYGFSVIGTFEYAEDAADFILENEPDVVFSDITLPGISGIDLIKMLRQREQNMKIVIISGYFEFSYMQSALRMEVFDYLLKPISKDKAEDLLKRLKEQLDNEFGVADMTKMENVIENIHNVKFKKLVKYVNVNYDKPLSLQTLAEKFGLNSSYCSQLFNKYFNCGFSSYLIAIRMNKAAELLKEGKYSIAEVAEMVQYEYVHFNKLFKEYFGVTPYQYSNQ